jgi:hypothetical protein
MARRKRKITLAELQELMNKLTDVSETITDMMEHDDVLAPLDELKSTQHDLFVIGRDIVHSGIKLYHAIQMAESRAAIDVISIPTLFNRE